MAHWDLMRYARASAVVGNTESGTKSPDEVVYENLLEACKRLDQAQKLRNLPNLADESGYEYGSVVRFLRKFPLRKYRLKIIKAKPTGGWKTRRTHDKG